MDSESRPAWDEEPAFLPTRDEYSTDGRDVDGWILAWRQKHGWTLTDYQVKKLQHFQEALKVATARRSAQRMARMRRLAPTIVTMRMQGKTWDDIAVVVKVSKSALGVWWALFPDVFGPEMEAYEQKQLNLVRMMQAESLSRTRRKLAQEAPKAVDTLAELRDTGKEKTRLDASKAILHNLTLGMEKGATQSNQYGSNRARFVQAIVEKVLPGCTETQDAEVVDAGQIEGASEVHGGSGGGKDQAQGADQGQG